MSVSCQHCPLVAVFCIVWMNREPPCACGCITITCAISFASPCHRRKQAEQAVELRRKEKFKWVGKEMCQTVAYKMISMEFVLWQNQHYLCWAVALMWSDWFELMEEVD